ncbi:MAG: hypothetical protein DRJ15_17505 [Bacteroidetes bacterium]|nr:MAG: hypothetical protein DRJ15_17505 [Bacteroidota bacterium]
MTEDLTEQQDKVDALILEDLKIAGINYNCFRFKQWAIIIGVKMCTPPNLKSRLVYECLFEDGFIDYVPLSDIKNYLIEPR